MVTAKNDIESQVGYYMNLPYTMIIKHRQEQGGYYIASYVELLDLTMTGDTPEEAPVPAFRFPASCYDPCPPPP